jgi:hypothetical protein
MEQSTSPLLSTNPALETCPFAEASYTLPPEQPCPVCGDLGTIEYIKFVIDGDLDFKCVEYHAFNSRDD